MIHQKHTLHIINKKPQLNHTKKVLNIFKVNILNTSIFMHKIHYPTAPKISDPSFGKTSHKYTTKFSKLNYKRPRLKLSRSKFRMSDRDSLIWNNLLKFDEKQTIIFVIRIES